MNIQTITLNNSMLYSSFFKIIPYKTLKGKEKKKQSANNHIHKRNKKTNFTLKTF